MAGACPLPLACDYGLMFLDRPGPQASLAQTPQKIKKRDQRPFPSAPEPAPLIAVTFDFVVPSTEMLNYQCLPNSIMPEDDISGIYKGSELPAVD